MKRTNKVISIILSIVMLAALVPQMAFALTDCTASNLQWSSEDAGTITFDTSDEDASFYIRLYKDAQEITGAPYYPGGETSILYSYFRYDLAEYGSGTYYYTVENLDEYDETISNAVRSENFQYTKATELAKVNNVSCSNDILYWDTVDGAVEYVVYYGFRYGNNEFQGMFSVGHEAPGASLVEDGAYDEFESYKEYWGPTYMDNAKLVAKIYAIPIDRTVKEMSCVEYNITDNTISGGTTGGNTTGGNTTGGNTTGGSTTGGSTTGGSTTGGSTTGGNSSNIFNATLANLFEGVAEKGTTVVTSDIYSLVPQAMQFGLVYASSVYDEYINTAAKITFTNTKTGKKFVATQANSPLIYNGETSYNLEIPVPAEIDGGVYTVELDLDIANEKGAEDVKPFHFTITNFMIKAEPDFEFVGITEYDESFETPVPITRSKNVTVKINADAVNNFTKYGYACDGMEFGPFDITGDTLTITIDNTKGYQDFGMCFGNAGDAFENYTVTRSTSIIYSSLHTLTFMVNGEPFGDTLTFNVGYYLGNVEAPGRPSVPGYRFDGWEELPQTMPDEDVVINAIMTPVTDVYGSVADADGNLLSGATVTMGDISTTTDENGKFSFLEVPYGSYMITVTKNGMTKTTAITANSGQLTLESIVLSEKGTSATLDTEIKTVEGLDALLDDAVLSDEDKTYLETPGNTITIDAEADVVAITDPQSASIVTEMTNNYSQYTAGIFIDFTINKVKGGAETSTTPVTETDSLVSFVFEVPAAIINNNEFIVFREHNGVVDKITTVPNADGEYITVTNGLIKLFANKFSTYALAGRVVPTDYSSSNRRGSSVATASYKIKFNSNGGTIVRDISVTKNMTAEEPEAPTKEGYIFGGWYTDKELTAKFDFETKITKGITLYAAWLEPAEISVEIVLTIGDKNAVVNGEVIENDVAPKLVNDRTMLPIRFIAEKLGADVEWFGDTETVTISAEGIEISLVIGEDFAMVNGEKVELDSPSFVENDRTYLPIRFVAEKLGANVEWNEEAPETVRITK